MAANEHSEPHSFDIRPRHLAYLRAMRMQYNLPDDSKTLRVLLDFAIAANDQQERIYTEVRCPNCSTGS